MLFRSVAVIKPPVVMFASVALPEVLNVPVIFAPVPVTTTVVLPADTILTLPSATGMLTLLVPFDNGPTKLAFILPASTLPETEILPAEIFPVVTKLPPVILPLAVNKPFIPIFAKLLFPTTEKVPNDVNDDATLVPPEAFNKI